MFQSLINLSPKSLALYLTFGSSLTGKNWVGLKCGILVCFNLLHNFYKIECYHQPRTKRTSRAGCASIHPTKNNST